MALPNQNVTTKDTAYVIANAAIQINTLETPKSKDEDQEKILIEKLEKELALQ